MTGKVAGTLEWDAAADINMTSFRAMYHPAAGWAFEETVARLLAASEQDAMAAGDGYKVSVEFTGRFNGQVFSLYDYKGGGQVHIGGHDALDVRGLVAALDAALAAVEPKPYRATVHYDA